MKRGQVLFCTIIAVAGARPATAQMYDTNNVMVETFAGSGFYGYLDGAGQQTMFYNPTAIVADTSSNLFIWDSNNYRIRKITADGTVSTFAGGGTQTTGYGTNISLGLALNWNASITMAIDHSNALWITANAGSGRACLFRLGSDGYFSGIAYTNGLFFPDGLCVDSGNSVYVSDGDLQKIYRLHPATGLWDVFAGSGNSGSADGNGVFTSFSGPAALAADQADNIYVWDSGTYLIRKIDQDRNVVTVAGHSFGFQDTDGAGTNAAFYSGIGAMCVDSSGNLIMACGTSPGGSSVRTMTPTTNVTTLAGSFAQWGYANGPGSLALFSGPSGVCVSQGMIFVADTRNQRIRQITFNPAQQPVSPGNLHLSTYPGLQIIGTVGRTYRIESSPDMATWSTAATVLLTASPYLWLDQNAVGGEKFYRAFLLP